MAGVNLTYAQAAWSEVRKEMTEEKGLDGAVADRIWEYVQHKGMQALLSLPHALTTRRRSIIA